MWRWRKWSRNISIEFQHGLQLLTKKQNPIGAETQQLIACYIRYLLVGSWRIARRQFQKAENGRIVRHETFKQIRGSSHRRFEGRKSIRFRKLFLIAYRQHQRGRQEARIGRIARGRSKMAGQSLRVIRPVLEAV